MPALEYTDDDADDNDGAADDYGTRYINATPAAALVDRPTEVSLPPHTDNTDGESDDDMPALESDDGTDDDDDGAADDYVTRYVAATPAAASVDSPTEVSLPPDKSTAPSSKADPMRDALRAAAARRTTAHRKTPAQPSILHTRAAAAHPALRPRRRSGGVEACAAGARHTCPVQNHLCQSHLPVACCRCDI